MFAEFLLFLLVFPYGHTSVGLTVSWWVIFLLFIFNTVPSLFGAVNVRWVVRSDLHMCWERGECSLITHSSIIAPLGAGDGLVGLGVLDLLSVF